MATNDLGICKCEQCRCAKGNSISKAKIKRMARKRRYANKGKNKPMVKGFYPA